MNKNFLIGFALFLMKYFLNVEREISQQLLIMMHIRLHDCKEIVTNFYHLALMNK